MTHLATITDAEILGQTAEVQVIGYFPHLAGAFVGPGDYREYRRFFSAAKETLFAAPSGVGGRGLPFGAVTNPNLAAALGIAAGSVVLLELGVKDSSLSQHSITGWQYHRSLILEVAPASAHFNASMLANWALAAATRHSKVLKFDGEQIEEVLKGTTPIALLLLPLSEQSVNHTALIASENAMWAVAATYEASQLKAPIRFGILDTKRFSNIAARLGVPVGLPSAVAVIKPGIAPSYTLRRWLMHAGVSYGGSGSRTWPKRVQQIGRSEIEEFLDECMSEKVHDAMNPEISEAATTILTQYSQCAYEESTSNSRSGQPLTLDGPTLGALLAADDRTQPVLVYFTASWCGFCKGAILAVDEVAATLLGLIVVLSNVDADDLPSWLDTQIKELPTLVLFLPKPSIQALLAHPEGMDLGHTDYEKQSSDGSKVGTAVALNPNLAHHTRLDSIQSVKAEQQDQSLFEEYSMEMQGRSKRVKNESSVLRYVSSDRSAKAIIKFVIDHSKLKS